METFSYSLKSDGRCCLMYSCFHFRLFCWLIGSGFFIYEVGTQLAEEGSVKFITVFLFVLYSVITPLLFELLIYQSKKDGEEYKKLEAGIEKAKTKLPFEQMKIRLEKERRDDPAPFCYFFKVICCVRREKNRRKAKARDVADTNSSWFKNINTMASEYKTSKQDTNRSCCSSVNQVKPEGKLSEKQPLVKKKAEDLEDVTNAEDLEEKLNKFEGLQFTAKRLVNRVSLMASYTDLMYFIEALMPSKAPKASQTSAMVYYEMAHSSLLLEITVATLQMAVVALINGPVVFFALAWAFYETFYFGDLLGESDLDDVYNSLTYGQDMVPLICTRPFKWTGGYKSTRYADCERVYLRVAPFIVVVLWGGFIYLILEYVNALNLYLLHGTKAEIYGEHHRLLEWRRIAQDQARRERKFGDKNSWTEMKRVNAHHIYISPWTHICCAGVLKYNFFAIIYHWFHAMWCGNQGSCCHSCWVRGLCTPFICDKRGRCFTSRCFRYSLCCGLCCCRSFRKRVFDEGEEVVVKLPGWKNKFLGTVKKVNKYTEANTTAATEEEGGTEAKEDTYDVIFLSEEYHVNLSQLKGKHDRFHHQNTNKISSEISETRAEVGDLLLAKKPLLEMHSAVSNMITAMRKDGHVTGENSAVHMAMIRKMAKKWMKKATEKNSDPNIDNTTSKDSVSFVCRVTKTSGKGSQRRHLARVIYSDPDTDESNDTNAGTNASTTNASATNATNASTNDNDIRHRKSQNHYLQTVDLDIGPNDIEYIFHSYPRLSWWDKKENEYIYLRFQLGFRMLLNVFRTIFFILSMFVLFGAALWCILGVFIFPEKFAPYSTAIFTSALNVKVLYGNSVAKLKELESRLIEGVKKMRLTATIAGLRRHVPSSTSGESTDYAGAVGSYVREPADGAGGNGGASGTASQNGSSTDTQSSSRHSSSSTHRIRTKNGRIINPTETQKRESKELKERLVKFLQNPSEAGLGDAELFEDATFNKILPTEFKNIKALKDKLGMYLLFKIVPCFLLVLNTNIVLTFCFLIFHFFFS